MLSIDAFMRALINFFIFLTYFYFIISSKNDIILLGVMQFLKYDIVKKEIIYGFIK